MNLPTETAIVRAVVDYLTLQGHLAIRINSGGVVRTDRGRKRFVRFNSVPGTSDVLACIDGTFAAIEVKRPGGKLTPEQASFLDLVRTTGGLGVCVTSVADLKAALAAEFQTGGG